MASFKETLLEDGAISEAELAAAEQLAGGIGHQLGELGIVVHRWRDTAVAHPRLTAIAGADRLHRVFDPARQLSV